jgi:hypothetical protein
MAEILLHSSGVLFFHKKKNIQRCLLNRSNLYSNQIRRLELLLALACEARAIHAAAVHSVAPGTYWAVAAVMTLELTNQITLHLVNRRCEYDNTSLSVSFFCALV